MTRTYHSLLYTCISIGLRMSLLLLLYDTTTDLIQSKYKVVITGNNPHIMRRNQKLIHIWSRWVDICRVGLQSYHFSTHLATGTGLPARGRVRDPNDIHARLLELHEFSSCLAYCWCISDRSCADLHLHHFSVGEVC